MNLDPRIIEGKRVLTPFDIEEAEQFNGCSGYFSNVTDDFKHLENAARGVLILGFGETPYRYRNNDGEASTSGCLYFLPDAWSFSFNFFKKSGKNTCFLYFSNGCSIKIM